MTTKKIQRDRKGPRRDAQWRGLFRTALHALLVSGATDYDAVAKEAIKIADTAATVLGEPTPPAPAGERPSPNRPSPHEIGNAGVHTP